MTQIYHAASYQAPHDSRKTVMEFESACKHDDTVLVVFEFYDYLLEDVKQSGDIDVLVQQAVNERCRQDHQRKRALVSA